MSTPEGDVKKYLAERIKALGGEVRFVKWIGRRHCPDTYVMFPNGGRVYEVNVHDMNESFAARVRNCWAETKAPGKRPRPGQEREHKRMRAMGEIVLVLPTKEDIDREFPL